MQTVIFDDHYHKAFYPICKTRAVGDLRCGILKLRQRLDYAFGSGDSALLIDGFLMPLYRERHPRMRVNDLPAGEKLYLNSRIILDDAAVEEIKNLRPNQLLFRDDVFIAIRCDLRLDFGFNEVSQAERIQSQIGLYQNLSDLIHDNARLISRDFDEIFYEEDNYFETETGVSVLNPYKVWISEGVSMAPNVVLDATSGPIVIDSGVRIMANAVISGPAYIGKNSLIKIGAKIYPGSSIGPVCKIGGEVEDSIFQAYSNKQHDGFLGHSYVGEWVNLGADTNNSDLKNTYKNVKIYSYLEEEMIDSGTQFMGCVLGDHSKTGINTSLNTGLVVGVGSNLYGGKLFSGYIPDFSWGKADSLTKYRFADFCHTASLVKQRRGLELSEADIQLLKHISGE